MNKLFETLLQACPVSGEPTRATMTVVLDGTPLGKTYSLQSDGTVKKEARVATSLGRAMTFDVPDAPALVRLLEIVGRNQKAALINSSFVGMPSGVEFYIGSEPFILRTYGPNANPRIQYQYEGLTLIPRVKEMTLPSAWQLLDRDIDEYTPTQHQGDHESWLATCESLLPGLLATTRVVLPSASARVLLNGKPVGEGNGHVWVRITNADDAPRVSRAILARACALDIAWLKPKFSKKTGERLPGSGMWTTPIDHSAWGQARLVFDGCPSVRGEGLQILPPSATLIRGDKDTLDTSAAAIDTAEAWTRSSLRGMPVRISDKSAEIVMANLTPDTILELKDGTEVTVAQMKGRGKTRCQAPFRASSSMAAF